VTQLTAEIAILNKSAVALAADSKVTLTTRGGGQKTYDTANKLFALSKTEPVGIMIYGNAEFMGFPLETIIKEYRSKRIGTAYPRIRDWAVDFLAFCEQFFPFKASDYSEVVQRICVDELNEVKQTCRDGILVADGKSKLDDCLQEELSSRIALLEKIDDYYSESDWNDIKSNYGDIFKAASESEGFSQDDNETFCLACSYVESFLRKKVLSSARTGIVISGFGEDELLPSLYSYETDGIISGKTKYLVKGDHDVSRSAQGLIAPFAQRDMVERFMEGIDPQLTGHIFGAVEKLLEESAVRTAVLVGVDQDAVEQLKPVIVEAVRNSVSEFRDALKGLCAELYSSPIIDMAMSLPKDELAHLAEALVSLTSLQRRVSREIETVGGAIDVVVISKGDGLVWIKRKHYFSADRNLRFVNGYFMKYAAEQNRENNNDE
jgi:hypothetical protein